VGHRRLPKATPETRELAGDVVQQELDGSQLELVQHKWTGPPRGKWAFLPQGSHPPTARRKTRQRARQLTAPHGRQSGRRTRPRPGTRTRRSGTS
jgi:hypothetical protein